MHVKKDIVVKFPKEEKCELSSQLQRAALSLPLNIVESCGRYTGKDFVHFPDNADETGYCCFAASELKHVSNEEYSTINKMINETRGMLIAFLKLVRRWFLYSLYFKPHAFYLVTTK